MDDQLNTMHTAPKSAEISAGYRKEGNALYAKKHDGDSQLQMLILYTKSIAFALENSEELALGYGNRSALLLHIQKYKECITDIDKALQISKSDQFKAKLASRKTECLKLIAEQTKTNIKQLDFPKIVPSDKVACVVKRLSLEFSEKYCRHMIANQDIEPGEIIAVEESYISYPLMSKLYLVCSHCLAQTWNASPCDYCTESVYCSQNCKSKAWQEYHDIECTIIFFNNISKLSSSKQHPLKEQIDNAGLRLLIKIIKSHGFKNIIQEVRQSAIKPFDGTFSCNQFLSCYNLTTGTPNEEGNMTSKNFIASSIKLFSQNKNIFSDEARSYFESETQMLAFAENLLMRFINIFRSNSYWFESVIEDCKCKDHFYKSTDCGCRGIIFGPCCSLFNHSCIANTDWFFRENKIVLFSNQPIRKGEQIFTNYRTHMEMPKIERQLLLKEKYSFICNCQACTENWLIPPTNHKSFEKEKDKFYELACEFKNFCTRQGMEKLVLNDCNKWKNDEKTLGLAIKWIKLSYEKLNPYYAHVTSSLHKDYMRETLCKLYGVEWEKMKNS